jgi:hypothetical protein
MPKLGGTACKYIKKAKYCVSPCTKIHNSKTKHKWYCKQTKKCVNKNKKHKKKRTIKRNKSKSVEKTEESKSGFSMF